MKTILLLAVLFLAGCAHHPLDCAIGLPWSDCLPGTAGYTNSAGADTREAEAKAKPQSTDLYTELTKLDDLRKKGLLTDAEYDVQKQKLLSHNQ